MMTLSSEEKAIVLAALKLQQRQFRQRILENEKAQNALKEESRRLTEELKRVGIVMNRIETVDNILEDDGPPSAQEVNPSNSSTISSGGDFTVIAGENVTRSISQEEDTSREPAIRWWDKAKIAFDDLRKELTLMQVYEHLVKVDFTLAQLPKSFVTARLSSILYHRTGNKTLYRRKNEDGQYVYGVTQWQKNGAQLELKQ